MKYYFMRCFNPRHMSGRNPYCPFLGEFNSNQCLAVTFAFQWESVRHELNYREEKTTMLILGNGDGPMNGGHHERPCFQKQCEDDVDGQQSIDTAAGAITFSLALVRFLFTFRSLTSWETWSIDHQTGDTFICRIPAPVPRLSCQVVCLLKRLILSMEWWYCTLIDMLLLRWFGMDHVF